MSARLWVLAKVTDADSVEHDFAAHFPTRRGAAAAHDIMAGIPYLPLYRYTV